MIRRLTNIFKGKSKDCTNPDCSRIMDNIPSMIDGEVTEEEKKFFLTHVDKCQPCLEKYNIEKSLLETIRTKITKKSCPDKLIQEIKLKIKDEKVTTN